MTRTRRSRISPWMFALLWILGWLPFLLAIPHALHAHPSDPFQGLSGLGGVVAPLIAVRIRQPEFRALTKADRRRVRDAVRTGQPTQDRRLDTLATGFLVRQVKSVRFSVTYLCFLALVVEAICGIAAIRSGQSLWWAAGIPVCGLALAVFVLLRRHPPQERLDRLLSAIHETGDARDGNPA